MEKGLVLFGLLIAACGLVAYTMYRAWKRETEGENIRLLRDKRGRFVSRNKKS